MNRLNWPNRITVARIIFVAPLVICLLNLNEGWIGWRRAAFVLFVLMALSDALDGYLARRFHEETPLGRFLDPVADKLLITCAVIILAVSVTAVPNFQLPRWVPVIAVGKDMLIVIGFVLVYAASGQWLFRPRIWGKVCTLVQCLMVAVVLAAPDLPPATARFVPATWWVASGLAVVAALDYLWIGNRSAADAPPVPRQGND